MDSVTQHTSNSLRREKYRGRPPVRVTRFGWADDRLSRAATAYRRELQRIHLGQDVEMALPTMDGGVEDSLDRLARSFGYADGDTLFCEIRFRTSLHFAHYKFEG